MTSSSIHPALRQDDSDGRGRRRPRSDALIDRHTPYEDDDRCWYVTEVHPDGLTLQEIGALLGLTRERVRQILERAIAKLARQQGHSKQHMQELLWEQQRARDKVGV